MLVVPYVEYAYIQFVIRSKWVQCEHKRVTTAVYMVEILTLVVPFPLSLNLWSPRRAYKLLV